MNRDHTTVWDGCLRVIRTGVNAQSFKTWFEPIKSVALKGDKLTIQVPNKVFYDWLESHYVQILKQAICKELGETAKLEYQILLTNRTPEKPANGNGNGNKPNPNGDLHDITKINNPWVIPGIRKPHIDPQLNTHYSFDSFIEGDCNKMTRAAAMAVAKKPGETGFNPLYIYGKTGLGKTHLVQAIGNEVVRQLPDRRVMYVTSEKFGNQIVHAIKNNAVNDLLLYYQYIDVLILDDIQLLAKREKTQEIFFHIFNHLHQNRKQLIFTSDKLPRDLEGIDERLVSRFKWGLSTELQVPDFETRIAILETKLNNLGLNAPKDVVELLAHHLTNHVRDLEGISLSIKANVQLNNRKLDVNLARELLKNYVNTHHAEITIELIMNKVSAYYNLTSGVLSTQSRKQNVVLARQISMFLIKKLTDHPLKTIGDAFGGRDHSTVIHSCKMVMNLVANDPLLRDNIDELERIVRMGN